MTATEKQLPASPCRFRKAAPIPFGWKGGGPRERFGFSEKSPDDSKAKAASGQTAFFSDDTKRAQTTTKALTPAGFVPAWALPNCMPKNGRAETIGERGKALDKEWTIKSLPNGVDVVLGKAEF